MSTEEPAKIFCSFCGKSQDEVRKIIAGPSVYICDECIDLCNDILAEDTDAADTTVSHEEKPHLKPIITERPAPWSISRWIRRRRESSPSTPEKRGYHREVCKTGLFMRRKLCRGTRERRGVGLVGRSALIPDP